jgi:hypothetical protein
MTHVYGVLQQLTETHYIFIFFLIYIFFILFIIIFLSHKFGDTWFNIIKM